jgi:DNA-binding PadR family transcriptional regulator
MIRGFSRRWLHPQAVPRGFLRLYILMLLSRGPETGYSIMQKIEDRTDGAWRPGPGTMYPLLKGLVSAGLARAVPAKKGSGTKAYHITSRGRKDLDEMREGLASTGRKERVLVRLFSDLLPASEFVPTMINRYKEGFELFRRKIPEIPQMEREAHLKDLRLLTESQVQWIDSQLEGLRPQAQKPRAKSYRGA